MKEEEKPKTIKEEMESEKIIITISADKGGGIGYTVNKDGVPMKFLRQILRTLDEQLLVDEIMFIVDRHFMKKMGVNKTKLVQ